MTIKFYYNNQHINTITVSKEWKKDFSAVVLLKEVKCTLLDALMLYNIGFSNVS